MRAEMMAAATTRTAPTDASCIAPTNAAPRGAANCRPVQGPNGRSPPHRPRWPAPHGRYRRAPRRTSRPTARRGRGRADAAEQRDPERSAQLRAGRREADAAPARSGGAAVMIISLPIVNTGAIPRLMTTVPMTSTVSPCGEPTKSDAKPRGRDAESDRQDGGGLPAPREPRRQERPDDEPECPGQRRQARLQWSQSEHELQILGDKDVHAEHRETRQPVRRDSGAEAGLTEQREVEQRVGEPALTADEKHPDDHTHGHACHGTAPPPCSASCLT
jgi:hypothetical protein